MPKRVFISYRYADLGMKNNLLNLFAAQRGPIEGTPSEVKPSNTKLTEKEIDAKILAALEGCVGMIVVVGDDTHSSNWVHREVELAGTVKSMKKVQRIFVKHPQATGGVSPKFAHYPIIEWDPDAIAAIVRGWK